MRERPEDFQCNQQQPVTSRHLFRPVPDPTDLSARSDPGERDRVRVDPGLDSTGSHKRSPIIIITAAPGMQGAKEVISSETVDFS